MMYFSITELYMYKSYCPTTLQRRWSSLKCTALVSLFWSCALKIVDQSSPEKGRKRLNTFLLIRRQRNKNCIPFFRLSALSVNGGAPKTLFLHKIWESECFQAYQIDLDGWDNDYLFRSTNLMGTILLLFFICRVWVIFLPRGGRVVHHICVIIGSGSGLAIFCESVSYKWPLWEKKKRVTSRFSPQATRFGHSWYFLRQRDHDGCRATTMLTVTIDWEPYYATNITALQAKTNHISGKSRGRQTISLFVIAGLVFSRLVHSMHCQFIETQMLPFLWNCRHWLYWKLSLWQLSVQQVKRIS